MHPLECHTLGQVGVLKRKMPEATVGRKKMKEFLVRMIYVEMLGHDASFGYIKVGFGVLPAACCFFCF